MLVELQPYLFEKIDNLTTNQFVLLSLVLDQNQKNHQEVATIVSHMDDCEIQALIDQNYLVYDSRKRGINKYKATDKLLGLLNYESFKTFYDAYPTYVLRPDGTNSFLKGNRIKCEQQYRKIIRTISPEHLLDCLNKDIENKMMTGKLGYMKTMWKWLTQHEWESVDEQKANYDVPIYGTEIL